MRDLKAKLRDCQVATLTATLFKRGLHTRYLSGVMPLASAGERVVGEAFTIRAIPVREDMRAAVGKGAARNLHREAMAVVGAGQVVVFDGNGCGEVSPLGDIIALALKQAGVAGFVTDTGVNDLPAIADVGFAVWGRGPAGIPGSARIQVAEWNCPIGCAGVAVYPGDLIVADGTGVVCIPQEIATEVADEAWEIEQLEIFLTAEIAAGAPLASTYPPDEATRARYAAWRRDRGSV